MKATQSLLFLVHLGLVLTLYSCGSGGSINGEYLRTRETPPSKPGKLDVLRIGGGGLEWGYYNENYKDGAFDAEIYYGFKMTSQTKDGFTMVINDDVMEVTGTLTEIDGKDAILFEVGEKKEYTSNYTHGMLEKAFGTDPWVKQK